MNKIRSFREEYEYQLAEFREDCVQNDSEESLTDNLVWAAGACHNQNQAERFLVTAKYMWLINSFAGIAPILKSHGKPPLVKEEVWLDFKACRPVAIKMIALGVFCLGLVKETPAHPHSEILQYFAQLKASVEEESLMINPRIMKEIENKDELFIMVYRENGFH